MEELKTIEKDLEMISLILMRKHPFYGILLKSINIYYDEKTTDTPAYVYHFNLYITNTFLKMKSNEKLYVIVHELNHILLYHTIRLQRYTKILPHRIVNIACDAKANQYNFITEPYNLQPITLRTIAEKLGKDVRFIKTLEKMSTEEILELIKNNSYYIKLQLWLKESMLPNDIRSGSGRIIWKGDEKSNETHDERELEEKLTEKIMKAYGVAKSIGKLPGELETLIDKILKPQVNWKVLLRQTLTEAIGRFYKITFIRPNRRLPLLPGRKPYSIGKVVVLMDTSGSIEEKHLQQFAGEVYGIAHNTSDVIIIPWDVKVYSEIQIRQPNDAKKIKVTGRGGTDIREAVEYTLKKYPYAIHVILSDWNISHVNDGNIDENVIRGIIRLRPICVTVDSIPESLPEYMRKSFIEIRVW
jgi:predicted metal-dependent peptidase